jgi:hypothetical protein
MGHWALGIGQPQGHWCQLKVKGLSHKRFTPPLNPLPLARGGEVLRQQSRGGVMRIVIVSE